MADPRPHYNPQDTDKLRLKAIRVGSASLLAALKREHPRIIDHLQRKHTKG